MKRMHYKATQNKARDLIIERECAKLNKEKKS